jgi:23S rRNA pseudouridine2457 synthase
MAKLVLFNKPFDVLSQFTDAEGRATLKDYLASRDCEGCYPAGRLDRDSEGLLLLTDSGKLQQQIAAPQFKLPKTYWVQVEGDVSDNAIEQLRQGVSLKDGPTRPAQAERMAPPDVWPRHPPVRQRAQISTSWLKLTISEGRNRQVRRMTAAVGYPTLRLIRAQIGPWQLNGLSPGEFRVETVHAPEPAGKRQGLNQQHRSRRPRTKRSKT